MQFVHGRSSLHFTFFARQESHAWEARFRRSPGESGESPRDFLFVAEDEAFTSRFIRVETGCFRRCGEAGFYTKIMDFARTPPTIAINGTGGYALQPRKNPQI